MIVIYEDASIHKTKKVRITKTPKPRVEFSRLN